MGALAWSSVVLLLLLPAIAIPLILLLFFRRWKHWKDAAWAAVLASTLWELAALRLFHDRTGETAAVQYAAVVFGSPFVGLLAAAGTAILLLRARTRGGRAAAAIGTGLSAPLLLLALLAGCAQWEKLQRDRRAAQRTQARERSIQSAGLPLYPASRGVYPSVYESGDPADRVTAFFRSRCGAGWQETRAARETWFLRRDVDGQYAIIAVAENRRGTDASSVRSRIRYATALREDQLLRHCTGAFRGALLEGRHGEALSLCTPRFARKIGGASGLSDSFRRLGVDDHSGAENIDRVQISGGQASFETEIGGRREKLGPTTSRRHPVRVRQRWVKDGLVWRLDDMSGDGRRGAATDSPHSRGATDDEVRRRIRRTPEGRPDS